MSAKPVRLMTDQDRASHHCGRAARQSIGLADERSSRRPSVSDREPRLEDWRPESQKALHRAPGSRPAARVRNVISTAALARRVRCDDRRGPHFYHRRPRLHCFSAHGRLSVAAPPLLPRARATIRRRERGKRKKRTIHRLRRERWKRRKRRRGRKEEEGGPQQENQFKAVPVSIPTLRLVSITQDIH